MSWDFDLVAPVLNAIGMAAANREPLDTDELMRELGTGAPGLEMLLKQVDVAGLAFSAPDDSELSPLLTRAGRQYLAMKGDVPHEVLSFLPNAIDDLHARSALIHGGTVLVDDFRHAVVNGRAVDHASQLVPDAFASAIDEALAINLFAAAVALMARLSAGDPAGCLAEEIVAIPLLENASVWLDVRCEQGELDVDDADAAKSELRGIFELFEDDDVLALFEMEEPADAALAGHSRINQMAGVADQRIDAWFRPFGGATATGHLDERPKG